MRYEQPTLDILDDPETYAPLEQAEIDESIDRLAEQLDDALASFHVDAKVTGRDRGASVTRFEVTPGPGVRVDAITKLERDLALAVAAPAVRILAPIPGRSAVGVEVPNPVRETVHLRSLLEAEPVDMDLALPIGADVAGRAVWADLAALPHLLVAGTTGSGKSAWINAALTTLAMQHTPSELELVLIDPKQVDLEPFADLPHLRRPLVTKTAKAVRVLEQLVEEMESRYRLLRAAGVKNIADHNVMIDVEYLPRIVVVVDEMADLMMTAGKRAEEAIVKLAQKARAAGIHLILATQRPTVKVVTGLIKGNVPARLCFTVASVTDSMVALDRSGAQGLAGRGDALFIAPTLASPERVQAPWVTADEVHRVVAHYADQRAAMVEEVVEVAAEVQREDDEKAALAALYGVEDDEPTEARIHTAPARQPVDEPEPITAEVPIVQVPYEDTMARTQAIIDTAREAERTAAAREVAARFEARVATSTMTPERPVEVAKAAMSVKAAPDVTGMVPRPYERLPQPLTVSYHRPVAGQRLSTGDVWLAILIGVLALVVGVAALPLLPFAAAAWAVVWFVQDRRKGGARHGTHV